MEMALRDLKGEIKEEGKSKFTVQTSINFPIMPLKHYLI